MTVDEDVIAVEDVVAATFAEVVTTALELVADAGSEITAALELATLLDTAEDDPAELAAPAFGPAKSVVKSPDSTYIPDQNQSSASASEPPLGRRSWPMCLLEARLWRRTRWIRSGEEDDEREVGGRYEAGRKMKRRTNPPNSTKCSPSRPLRPE